MRERISLFVMSGLPESFGYLCLSVSLVLLLSPYLAGADFGIIKIPSFSPRTSKRLKTFAPFVFVLVAALFIPFFPGPLPTLPPDLAGLWQRQSDPPDHTQMRLSQSSGEISATLTYLREKEEGRSTQVTEKLVGHYIQSEGYFDVAVEHVADGCVTKLFGRLYPLRANQFKTTVYASASDCAPCGHFGSESIWSKM